MKSGLLALSAPLAAGLALLSSSLLAAPSEEVAIIRTKYGEITFRFFSSDAPRHTAYVKELIRRRFYDGTTFHRVIPYFVIQGGDPNSKDSDRSNDGDGEADRRLKAEFSQKLHYRPGTVGMARDADPDSGSCQLFIALESIPRLDGKYTIFGEVITGLDVARRIGDLPRDLKDNPLERVEMKVVLGRMKVPAAVVSLETGENGEVLTGPGKPKPWDPGSARWSAPALPRGAWGSLGTEAWPKAQLDLSVGETGGVLDVRFVQLETEHAEEILAAVKEWKFSPARWDDTPIKARFSLDSLGDNLAPSRAPGTPGEIDGEVTAPALAIPIPLAAGARAPAKGPVLRLTVDEAGRVADVSLQLSCGDAALDEAALSAARKMVFVPAMRKKDPVPVYLNLPGRFVETPAP